MPRLAARHWTIAAVLVALIAYEAHALFLRRSGEAAFLPPRGRTQLSPEIAGRVTLTQTFVPAIDDLDAIGVYARPASAAPGGHVHLTLMAEGYADPIARAVVPAADVAGASPFRWPVPRVAGAVGRTFTLRVAVPDAPPGQGLRFEIGPPEYPHGELTIDDRSFWGDLKFDTRARRAHLVTLLAGLRRRLPAVLRNDAVLVFAALAINWALVTLIVGLVQAASGPAPARPAGGRSVASRS